MASQEPKLRLITLIAVALGGVLGATARVYLPWPSLLDEHLAIIDPVPVAIVNLLGAGLLGLVSGYTALRPWPEPLVKGVTTGFLGTFTTMSALAVVYTGFTVGQAVFGTATLSTLVLTTGLLAVLLGCFLWLTTLITMGTYRVGARLAASSL